MAFMAALPLVSSLLGGMLGGGGGGGGGGGAAAAGAARDAVLTTPGTPGSGSAAHPVTVVHSPAHPTTGPGSPAALMPLTTGQVAPQHPVTQRNQEALNRLHTDQQSRSLREDNARMAREQVREVRSSIQPELDAIHAQLSQRSRQIQATSEHRDLIAQQAFRTLMENGLHDAQRRLTRLQASVDRLHTIRRRY